MNKATIGTVSHGTMRTEDLYDAFLSELEYLDPAAHAEFLEEMQGRCGDEAVEKLFDLLDERAPLSCYFGANPGDGADYGFWECEDFE